MRAFRRRADSSSSTIRTRMTGTLTFSLMAPLHVADFRGAVQYPAGDEQQVRQAVQVLPRRRAHGLGAPQGHYAALGAPAHRAREVRRRRGARSARQDEFLERLEVFVPLRDLPLEKLDPLGLEHGVAGDAELPAQVEEVVLHLAERGAHFLRRLFREQQAERGIELIDVAQRSDARIVFRHARAVAQAGVARVAGARRDLREAMAHQEVFFTSLATRPLASVVVMRSPSRNSPALRSTLPALS